MKKTLALIAILLLPMAVNAEQCELDPDVLAASYEIKKNSPSTSEKANVSYHMTIWRDTHRVAKQFDNSHITQLWEKNSHNTLKLVRYFDMEQRAIEYQPEDIKIEDADSFWTGLRQLITQQQLATMTMQSSIGTGCDEQQFYQRKQGDSELSVTWLPALNLVKAMKEVTPRGSKEWTLVSTIADKNQINHAFEKREAYLATDYADIGDNESDPFLIKMINLGHIRHGASGFYDEHGHAIGGAEHHH